MAKKLTDAMKKIITDNYDPIGESKEYNKSYFKEVQKMEGFDGVSDAQIRAILVNAEIYEATSPRTEPKKNGIVKADLVKRLNELAGTEIANAMKLTIADIEALIEALDKEEIDFTEVAEAIEQ